MVNPIGQIGKLNKMRQAADKKKKEMEAIKVAGESDKGRVKVTLNGVHDIVNMEIDNELLSPERKEMLVKAINSAYSDAKKKLEKELAKTVDIKQLMDMLG